MEQSNSSNDLQTIPLASLLTSNDGDVDANALSPQFTNQMMTMSMSTQSFSPLSSPKNKGASLTLIRPSSAPESSSPLVVAIATLNETEANNSSSSRSATPTDYSERIYPSADDDIHKGLSIASPTPGSSSFQKDDKFLQAISDKSSSVAAALSAAPSSHNVDDLPNVAQLSNDQPALWEGSLSRSESGNSIVRHVRIFTSPCIIAEYDSSASPVSTPLLLLTPNSRWAFAHSPSTFSILLKSKDFSTVYTAANEEEHRAWRSALMALQEVMKEEERIRNTRRRAGIASEITKKIIDVTSEHSKIKGAVEKLLPPSPQPPSPLKKEVESPNPMSSYTPLSFEDAAKNIAVKARSVAKFLSTRPRSPSPSSQPVSPVTIPSTINLPNDPPPSKDTLSYSYSLPSTLSFDSIDEDVAGENSDLNISVASDITKSVHPTAFSDDENETTKSKHQNLLKLFKDRKLTTSHSLSHGDISRPLKDHFLLSQGSEGSISYDDGAVSDYPKYVQSVKNTMYRKLFNLPVTEELTDDFTCAVQKTILLHGRMYISNHYICFYSSIFSHKTTLVLETKDVLAVQPAKVALVFDNSLKVFVQTGPLPVPILFNKPQSNTEAESSEMKEESGIRSEEDKLAEAPSFAFTLSAAMATKPSLLSREQIAYLISINHPNIATYFFASFMARDPALRLIETILRNRDAESVGVLPSIDTTNLTIPEMYEIESDSPNPNQPVTESSSNQSSGAGDALLTSSVCTPKQLSTSSAGDAQTYEATNITTICDESIEEINQETANALVATIDFGEGNDQPPLGDHQEDDWVLLTTTFPISAKLFVALFIDDNAPYSLASYWKTRPDDADFRMTAWSEVAQSVADTELKMQRKKVEGDRLRHIFYKMTFSTPVGPPITRVHRIQRFYIDAVSPYSVRIDSCSVTPDITFGDIVYTIERWKVVDLPNSTDGGCELAITGGVRFRCRPWKLKPFLSLIQNRTRDESKKTSGEYKQWVESMLKNTDKIKIVQRTLNTEIAINNSARIEDSVVPSTITPMDKQEETPLILSDTPLTNNTAPTSSPSSIAHSRKPSSAPRINPNLSSTSLCAFRLREFSSHLSAIVLPLFRDGNQSSTFMVFVLFSMFMSASPSLPFVSVLTLALMLTIFLAMHHHNTAQLHSVINNMAEQQKYIVSELHYLREKFEKLDHQHGSDGVPTTSMSMTPLDPLVVPDHFM